MIVAGFGFRADATVASLQDALAQAQGAAPDCLATLSDKAATDAFQDFARQLGVAIQPIATDLAAQEETLSQSAASLATYGIGSVAEACALAAAGPGARLLGPRCVSTDRKATCAIAEGLGP
ncbi:MAG: cobalamin biosynthesis protein [Pseudomonadota bacterium]